MSEVGRQLVENAEQRDAALREARQQVQTLFAATNYSDEAGLAELDEVMIDTAVELLKLCRRRMRVLRAERAQLMGRAADGRR